MMGVEFSMPPELWWLPLFLVGMVAKSDNFNSGRTASDLRDETEGKGDSNHLYSWAVKVLDEELSRILADKKEAWEEWKDVVATTDKKYEETTEYRRIVSKATTLNATQAAKSERFTLLKYFTSRAESPQLKHFKLVRRLLNWILPQRDSDVTQIYMTGEQGAGKTNFAILLAETWLLANPDGKILTNIESLERAVYIEGMDALDEWLEDNEGTPFIFLFDEANKHASGVGDSSQVEGQLFPLVTLIRKRGGHYIIIGHVANDIHRWIRELCDFVHKESHKIARVYNGVKDGEPEGLMHTFRGIPETSLDYDDGEESDWDWSDDRVRTCIGTTKDGERCGSTIRIPYGEEPEFFCDAHKNQNDPHEEVAPPELRGTPYEEYIPSRKPPGEDSTNTETTDSDSPEGVDDARGEPVLSEESESDGEDDADETAEEVRDSADTEENPTPNESTADEQDGSTALTVENIPPDGWGLIFKKTELTKEYIDSWSQIESILNDRELQDLKRMMD